MSTPKERILYCQVVQPCMGVKKPTLSGQKIKYKHFHAGERVSGKEYNAASVPSQYVPAIITKDRYIITQNNLMLIGEEQQAEIIDDKKLVIDKVKDKFRMFQNADGANGIITDASSKSKYTINGAIAGGVLITVYNAMKGNGIKLNGFILGAVLGGFVGKMFYDYKKK